MKPFVSIIVPFFNAEKTITSTIQSVIDQSFREWELILVDDGSTDDSVKICKEFLSYPNVRLIQQLNRGVSAARNFGASYANGKYLTFLDADDSISMSHLADFYHESFDYPEVLTCDMKIYTGKKKMEKTIRKNESYRSSIPGSWMIRKDIFQNIGGFDERLKFAENTELFFRFDQQDRFRKHIQKENLFYHQSEAGGSKNLQNMLDSIRIILEKHDDYLNAHVKHLYHQNIGVIEMRFGNFKIARQHLWKSWKYKPLKISTPIRILLGYFPFMARRIYTVNVQKS